MAVKFQLASAQLPLILVKVAVSGKRQRRVISAILDTGATGCVIAQSLATDLELEHLIVPKREKSAHGIGGEIKVEFVKVHSVSLDGITMKNIKTAVMDLSVIDQQFKAMGVTAKKKVGMILGYSFFKGRKLLIDYKRKTLSIQ
ncbi:MAG: retropepsin-like aspartic protease [Chloroherpetonaceae bacterium]